MSQDARDDQPAGNKSLPSANARVIMSLALPLAGAIAVALLAGGDFSASLFGAPSAISAAAHQRSAVLLLGPLAIISWFMGLRWYGLAGMGLRGRRPLFSGIGFAVLGWIAFLLFRLFLEIDQLGTGSRDFVFLLLFEAFSVQLWVFGLVFHSLADWRGPLTAAVSSGVIFGAVAASLFMYSFIPNVSGFFYFLLWGIFYGIIRLRTGSILGVVLVQAIQSFTGWIVLRPVIPPDPARLSALYVGAGLVYLLLIWRLWPKRESDYRV